MNYRLKRLASCIEARRKNIRILDFYAYEASCSEEPSESYEQEAFKEQNQLDRLLAKWFVITGKHYKFK